MKYSQSSYLHVLDHWEESHVKKNGEYGWISVQTVTQAQNIQCIQCNTIAPTRDRKKSSNNASIYQEEEEEKGGTLFNALHVCWTLPLTLMLPTKSILTGAKTVGPSLSEEKKSSLRCWVFSISDVYICSERAPKAGQAGNGPIVTAKEQVMASCKSLLMGWSESDPRFHWQNFIQLKCHYLYLITRPSTISCMIPQPVSEAKVARSGTERVCRMGKKKEEKKASCTR